jgi:hypothetical protein
LGEKLFYIFDNNPFHDESKRPRIYAELVGHLETKGCKLVGEAGYPLPSKREDQPGYTTAHVFRCADARGDCDVHVLTALAREKLFEVRERVLFPGDDAAQA